jgi:hypothetical protein
MVLLGYSGAQGTLIYEKNLLSKISCQTPFKFVIPILAVLCMLVKSTEMTGIGPKHCHAGWGRRVKNDRKQNTLAQLLVCINCVRTSTFVCSPISMSPNAFRKIGETICHLPYSLLDKTMKLLKVLIQCMSLVFFTVCHFVVMHTLYIDFVIYFMNKYLKLKLSSQIRWYGDETIRQALVSICIAKNVLIFLFSFQLALKIVQIISRRRFSCSTPILYFLCALCHTYEFFIFTLAQAAI